MRSELRGQPVQPVFTPDPTSLSIHRGDVVIITSGSDMISFIYTGSPVANGSAVAETDFTEISAVNVSNKVDKLDQAVISLDLSGASSS